MTRVRKFCMIAVSSALLMSSLFSPIYAEDVVYVGSKDVKLLLSVTDVGSGMNEEWFSTEKNADGNWINWTVRESYMNEKNITLPDGPDGEYCVAGMFSDNIGNETITPIVACCIVDTTIPGGSTTVDGIVINIDILFK